MNTNNQPARDGEAREVSKLEKISKHVGGFVKFIPALIGSDGKPIPLNLVVESMVRHLDMASLHAAYPNLTHSQILGAIAFLTKMSSQGTGDL